MSENLFKVSRREFSLFFWTMVSKLSNLTLCIKKDNKIHTFFNNNILISITNARDLFQLFTVTGCLGQTLFSFARVHTHTHTEAENYFFFACVEKELHSNIYNY